MVADGKLAEVGTYGISGTVLHLGLFSYILDDRLVCRLGQLAHSCLR